MTTRERRQSMERATAGPPVRLFDPGKGVAAADLQIKA
jgi:hypothetical protein